MASQQLERGAVTENLFKAYHYAFIETAPYSFYIPKKDQYVDVNATKKIYHCLQCGNMLEVRYRETGVVYFSKPRFEKQRELYGKMGLNFPTEAEIANATPFTCHEEGYCTACAPTALAARDKGQALYNVCLQMHRADEALIFDARDLMEEIIRAWLDSITAVDAIASYDLSRYEGVKDAICAAVLADTKRLDERLAVYRQVTMRSLEDAPVLLAALPESWDVFAARPTHIYESMSDELYHEYTVAFPVEGTEPCDFFVPKSLKKERVQMFLEQRRVEVIEELLMEAGFLESWIDLFIDRIVSLKK